MSGCLQLVSLLTIMDLATYLVVSEGNITPATEYVKSTMIAPPMKRASLTVTRNVFRICQNQSKVEIRSENNLEISWRPMPEATFASHSNRNVTLLIRADHPSRC